MGFNRPWNWGKGKKQPQISTIVEVDSDKVSCTGATNDHPKVWYTVPEGPMYSVDIVTSCSCVRNLQKQRRWTNTSMVQLTQRTE